MMRYFDIEAGLDPQSLPRILNLFAQRWLMPRHVSMRQEGERLLVAIEMSDLDRDAAELIAAKLRDMVLVTGVALKHAGEGVGAQ